MQHAVNALAETQQDCRTVTPAERVLIDTIRQHGPISFRDFMQTALYHPEYGYYTSRHNNIGQGGDYYTSPELSVLFGSLLARQLEEMWLQLGKGEFTIIEYGAGNGALCNSILQALKGNEPFYSRLHYSIIEKNRSPREKSHLRIIDQDKVTWHEHSEEMKSSHGCILSNEVLDNFPTHSMVMKDSLLEVFVDYNNEFIECLKPASPKLIDYCIRHKISPPRNSRFEINLDAENWMNDLTGILDKGFVITIDYGYSSRSQVFTPHGTVRCYKNQTVHTNPYVHIGEQDITSNVNFSALHLAGLNAGLNLVGYTNQAGFLRSLGLVNCLREMEMKRADSTNSHSDPSHIITLLNEMGDAFKVLIQSRNISCSSLMGVRLAQSL